MIVSYALPKTVMTQQHNTRRAIANGLLEPEFHYASLRLKHNSQSTSLSSVPAVWDYGSALYDSYEVSTFTQHLQRAIAAEETACIMKDGRVRSYSMPHFAPTSQSYKKSVVSGDDPKIEDLDFFSLSKIEPLSPKTRGRLRVPKLVQRLFTRLAR